MKTVKLRFKNETKGAVRYEEITESGAAVDMQDALVGTLYIRKSALDGTIPQEITLTINVEK